MTSDLIVVFITAGSADEAYKIAEKLLAMRLAACINVVPNIFSYYRWQGQLDNTKETLLIVKSQAALINDIIKSVKEIHSYEVPEIIALPIVGGNEDYLKWLTDETKHQP